MPAPRNLPDVNLLYQGTTTGWTLAQPTGGPGPAPSAVVMTATTTTDTIQVAGYNSVIAFLGVSTASGTLNVYIQQLMPDLVTWSDYATFRAVTTATAQYMGIVSAGNTVNSVTSLAEPAGNIRIAPIGGQWRWVFGITGTGATFTFTAGISFFG